MKPRGDQQYIVKYSSDGLMKSRNIFINGGKGQHKRAEKEFRKTDKKSKIHSITYA